MSAIEGIFDGTVVRIDTAAAPIKERCRVVVTFLPTAENDDAASIFAEPKLPEEIHAALWGDLPTGATLAEAKAERLRKWNKCVETLAASRDEAVPDFPRANLHREIEL
jgi:hypothetical protein